MRLTLIQLSPFVAKWAKLGLGDEDLQALECLLISNPQGGAVVPGTGGLRKLRFAPPSRHTGKRGALRVIYAVIPAADAVYYFTLYGKNEQADMTADEKRFFRQVLTRLHAYHSQ